ncbi:rhodanese-like domain-containing protein [Mucilaginibacter limnophilus]|uniref:Rhodanese-like domain-containing protein n=1 Tax=Mucilaginibacter limnophilus TaxID=1932778 RepID=A0A437MSB4_9SPHI|nr:rhodanese-like domain-containing protein [Mucilaginibacter limnophilus]RVU00516.1 rhodanese-like domain-containing protein [Mucilaginibacter limnophilus]
MSKISAAELTERLNNGDAPLLLDVREKIEYYTYNIGGINIPLSVLAEELEQLDDNKSAEIVVVCKAGIRSRTAQQILQQHGFGNVKNLTGGLTAIQKLHQSIK